jgi:hypothetical protein
VPIVFRRDEVAAALQSKGVRRHQALKMSLMTLKTKKTEEGGQGEPESLLAASAALAAETGHDIEAALSGIYFARLLLNSGK